MKKLRTIIRKEIKLYKNKNIMIQNLKKVCKNYFYSNNISDFRFMKIKKNAITWFIICYKDSKNNKLVYNTLKFSK